MRLVRPHEIKAEMPITIEMTTIRLDMRPSSLSLLRERTFTSRRQQPRSAVEIDLHHQLRVIGKIISDNGAGLQVLFCSRNDMLLPFVPISK
jgi:hypothetical protein